MTDNEKYQVQWVYTASSNSGDASDNIDTASTGDNYTINVSYPNDNTWTTGVWTTGGTTTTGGITNIPWMTVPEGVTYPELPNALGVIYVEDGEIRVRTPDGEDIVLGRIDDGDEKVAINIVAVIAKKALEKAGQET